MAPSVSRAGAGGTAPDWRIGMATKRKPGHSCELCRTLGDIARRLEPEKHQCGPELAVAEAIQAALERHVKRAAKKASVGPAGRGRRST